MIEIEVRSFLSEQEYKKLLSFFDEQATLVREDEQETHYFDCKEDLRVQKNKQGAKIWLKKGKLHDDEREEIEIPIESKDFAALGELFRALGMEVEIKWFRKRKVYTWRGVKVCLDNTAGYGFILELEKLVATQDTTVREELIALLTELGLKQSPKSEFTQRYEDYKRNWRKRIKEA